MSSEVADLIRALHDGTMTLDEVARRFRQRTWPPSRLPAPTSELGWAASALDDPSPHIHGSFDDVVAACERGDITEQQYEVLADAVADAIGRKHGRES